MKTWVIIVLLLVAGLGALTVKRINDSNAARAAVPEKTSDAFLIKSAKVERRAIDESVTFTGSVLPKNEVDIFPKLGGRIESVSVQVGDKVKAGQILAAVEHKEIAWQAKSAAAALEAAQANLLVAQVNLEANKVEYKRTEMLFKSGSAAQAQFEGIQLRLKTAEAQLAAAQAQVSQASAAKGLADQQLANAEITSPITGVVTKRSVDVGTNAGPGTAAFTVQDNATLKLQSSVQASVFSQLKRGMPAQITVDALPGESFTGKVNVMAPTLDPQTRRAQIELAIDNTNGRLLPHMFATASVTVGHLDNAVVIPKSALLEAAGGSIVYRIKDNHVETVHPQLGAESGGLISIVDGLTVGDELANSSLGNLSDGAAVRVSVSVSQN